MSFLGSIVIILFFLGGEGGGGGWGITKGPIDLTFIRSSDTSAWPDLVQPVWAWSWVEDQTRWVSRIRAEICFTTKNEPLGRGCLQRHDPAARVSFLNVFRHEFGQDVDPSFVQNPRQQALGHVNVGPDTRRSGLVCAGIIVTLCLGVKPWGPRIVMCRGFTMIIFL